MSLRGADRSAILTAATAVAVGAAYYAGANLGFFLRFPPATPSVMWAPNAILTATLLLAVPRRWWIYLLAAFPAHMVAELGAAWPTSLVLLLFVTNCSEAVLAAVGVRWFSDAPTRFDTLRRTAVFIVAAGLVAPFLSSFLDAAVVSALRGEPYWTVWQTRFFSNVLTELTLVPALVMAITAGPAWLRAASLPRRAEAAVLATSLLVVGVAALMGPAQGPAVLPEVPGTSPAFLLPFILWAAVRFGPGGAAAALVATALLAIAAVTHGLGPFARLALAQSVFALQIFLTTLAIPIMCLAALIEERRRAEQALGKRLRFEELLSRLTGAFVHLPGHAMDTAIETWLRRLGEFLRLDRILLFRLSADGQELEVAYSWTGPDTAVASRIAVSREFPWLFEQLVRDELVAFSSLADLPAEAVRDAAAFGRRGVRSNLTIPLSAAGRIFGGLAFVTVTEERAWPDELVQPLRLVAEVLASALARREAEEARRASELMKSAILASLPSGVAVLDRHGQIIAVNESWAQLAGDRDTWNAEVGLGTNYLDVCRLAESQGMDHAADAVAGIVGVLDGSRPGCTLEYACGLPVANRWFAMTVVPLNRPEGGAVVSHTDVTERKRAELDAQRSRQELAHVTRVSTMGELTASLAHELNQPLTGILANAQAARRFLEITPPDLAELRSIVSDIIEDDKRAGEIIRRLRDLLRKGEAQRVLLDVNTLVRDMVKLVSGDALIRNVTISLDLDPEPPIVTGDRVQVQQIILNLLLNAMEAMCDGASGERLLVVRTRRPDAETVGVAVQDSGPGLRRGTEEEMFEPFYTTKPTGMGMGLAIVRSIIEAHGGAVSASNNPTRGATVRFTLPRADGALA